MNVKKDGCDFKELENVLSQYIEKDQVETFVKKICRSGYRNQEEYFYVEQCIPEVPKGTFSLLVMSKKYYINMKLTTLWVLCVLLDIEITKGMAVALGGMTGILKQVVYKISEENAEKCVLLEIIRKNMETLKASKECINNHLECKYRDACDMCTIKEDDICSILQSLTNKGIIKKIRNTYKYIL